MFVLFGHLNLVYSGNITSKTLHGVRMDDTVRKPSILDLSGGNLAVKWDTWIKDFEWYLQGIGKEEAD